MIFGTLISYGSLSFAAQQDTKPNEPLLEEEIIGGIGGTGIRSLSRPEMLERPERIERPELLESREIMEDSLDLESAIGTDIIEIEKPELIEN